MNRSYSLGEYRISPALRELWRDDRLIALPPHVFGCLTYPLERHDRAVGRDELVAAVWGKTQISDMCSARPCWAPGANARAATPPHPGRMSAGTTSQPMRLAALDPNRKHAALLKQPI